MYNQQIYNLSRLPEIVLPFRRSRDATKFLGNLGKLGDITFQKEILSRFSSICSNKVPFIFRFPAYSPWVLDWALEIPRHLSAIFLLVLAVYTCLPLPTALSLAFGLCVSGLHIFALAVYGQDNLEVQEHYKKVRA